MAYLEDLARKLPEMMESALGNLELMLDDPDVDGGDKVKAFIELKKIIKETTGTSTGHSADVVSAYIDFQPAYLNKMVGYVMDTLEWVEWPVKDHELAKKIVAKWCKEQAGLATKMIETGMSVKEQAEDVGDGFRWDWCDERY